MNRRDFIKTAAASMAAVYGTGFFKKALAQQLPSPAPVDLVGIMGGMPDKMFDEGIKAMGGISRFVKKGQTVVVKPNIGWNSEPERGATTNPNLVSCIVKHCYDAGAKKVYVFDHTCNEWTLCYKNSGIEKSAKDAGAVVVTGEDEGHYQQIQINGGIKLKDAKLHELILSSDVFINVPILKHHGGGRITAAMKNLMGIVWDRRIFHRTDLHECIADSCIPRKPDLNVIDAYYVMMKNGPRGVSAADVAVKKTQIISTDIVAADTAAAKVFGIDISEVSHILAGQARKLGTTNLDSLQVKRLKMS